MVIDKILAAERDTNASSITAVGAAGVDSVASSTKERLGIVIDTCDYPDTITANVATKPREESDGCGHI